MNIVSPYVFAGRSIFEYFIVHLINLPALIVSIILIDAKRFGGRKNSLILSLLIYAILEILLYLLKEKFIFLGIILINFVEKICYVNVI
jgi:Na+/melibiose symporter-like transporter